MEARKKDIVASNIEQNFQIMLLGGLVQNLIHQGWVSEATAQSMLREQVEELSSNDRYLGYVSRSERTENIVVRNAVQEAGVRANDSISGMVPASFGQRLRTSVRRIING